MISETVIGVIKGDAWSLDYSSNVCLAVLGVVLTGLDLRRRANLQVILSARFQLVTIGVLVMITRIRSNNSNRSDCTTLQEINKVSFLNSLFARYRRLHFLGSGGSYSSTCY